MSGQKDHQHPSHIDLPLSLFGLWSTDNDPSPPLPFYTAPSSPYDGLPPQQQQQPVLTIQQESFPPSDFAIDMALDDDGLSNLEKIYLFSRSTASFHRVYIAHSLPTFLEQISPQEALEYVLPLLSGLAMDDDEQVKQTLAAELVHVIWWFFTHCQVIPDDLSPEDTVYPTSTSLTTISVQAFTPILGTLLLSPNPLVGGAARYTVVELLSRIKSADDAERLSTSPVPSDTGLFGREERAMFQQEILQQVVIGMGRLDLVEQDADSDGMLTEDSSDDDDSSHSAESGDAGRHDGSPFPAFSRDLEMDSVNVTSDRVEQINPYFPVLTSPHGALQASPAQNVTTTLPLGSRSTIPTPSRNHNISLTPLPKSSLINGDSDVSTGFFHNSLSAPAIAPSTLMENSSPFPSELRGSIEPDFSSDVRMPHAPRPSHAALPTRGAVSSSAIRPISPPVDGAQHSKSLLFGNGDSTATSFPHLENAGDQGSEEMTSFNPNEGDQAAVGRLSSMSLMAAVTASGSLGDDTKQAFVNEVERVSQDPVYWVRKEATFTLGALAKVVPEELIHCSLVPLFESLRTDVVSHVRHSSLFALPALLARVGPKRRRELALETLIPLSKDPASSVRLGVLEALGEVICTFRSDDSGPPEELLHIFLGRNEDRRVLDEQQTPLAFEDDFNDPERLHTRAFNYPAIAFTLGPGRWLELRDVYLKLAADRSYRVRRTLAASVGELAKIIGAEHARRDLVGVWWDSLGSEEESVRLKALECMGEFLPVIGQRGSEEIIEGVIALWKQGTFSSWRERECVAKAIVTVMDVVNHTHARELLKLALEDGVAGVREAAISLIGEVYTTLATNPPIWEQLKADLACLASSANFRRRMTFVACQQALIGRPNSDLSSNVLGDEKIWGSIALLARDSVVGVRIGVSRYVNTVHSRLSTSGKSIPRLVKDIMQQLLQDEAVEVRAYLANVKRASIPGHHPSISTDGGESFGETSQRIFSRPPPPPVMTGLGKETSGDTTQEVFVENEGFHEEPYMGLNTNTESSKAETWTRSDMASASRTYGTAAAELREEVELAGDVRGDQRMGVPA